MPKAQRSRACQQCRDRRVKCDETPNTCQQCQRLGLRCSGPLQGSVIIDMTDRVTKPRPRKKREVKSSPAVRTPLVSVKEESPAISSSSGSSNNADRGAGTGAGVVVKAEPDTADHPSTTSALPVAIIPPTRNPSAASTSTSTYNNTKLRGDARHDDAVARIQRHYRLPALYQPSRAVPDALDMAFISHFVQQNNNTRRYSPEVPFITHLPSLHGAASKPAVRFSIRATSMAFYAAIHHDTTILVDSYRWYTMSLHSQRQSLARLGPHSIPETEEIIVPILLSIYEAYAGTTTTSIWPHMAAAAKILELRGPNNCTGITSTLFKIMRVSDAHKAIVFNTPSVFATPPWMTLPFTHAPKSAHQELADIMMQLPPLLLTLPTPPGSLRAFFATPLPPTAKPEPVIARITDWLATLDEWARRFPYLTRAPDGVIEVLPDVVNMAAGVEVRADGVVALPDTFVAFTAASYEAIRCILFLLLRKLGSHLSVPPQTYRSPSSSSSSAVPTDAAELTTLATTAAQAVLNIATYQESTNQAGGFDVLRTVFPLVIVGNLAPGKAEMAAARGMLMRWGQRRGIAGLCAAWLEV